MPLVTTLNGVPINDDTLAGKGYLTALTGSDGVTLPNFLAQNWAIYKAALGTVAATWRVGAGVPSNALGIDGDFFLSTSGNVYLKTSGTYVFQTSLVGPAGSGSTIHVSQNGTGVTVAPRSRINFIGLAVADNAGADRIDVTAFSQITRSARSSNTILASADRGTLIDVASGTFTQTFTAAATLANGWWCYIRNSGTGNVSLDPNASELIDGLTSYLMYPGEVRLVQCDGTAFYSVVIESFSVDFTATGPFIKPPGYSQFGGFAWGGGGGGGKSGSGTTRCGGGGGGACMSFTFPASALAASETITVGAGGLATTVTGNGGGGGNSQIGSLFTVYGGGGGNSTNGGGGGGAFAAGGTGTGVGGAPLAGTSAGENSTFGGGGSGASAGSSVYGGGGSSSGGGASGSSIYGGGGGSALDTAGASGAAGASNFGGAGGASSSAGNGTVGAARGGGGGATQTGTTSGAGGRGEVRIWGII